MQLGGYCILFTYDGLHPYCYWVVYATARLCTFYRGTLQLAVELKKLHQSPVHKASRLKVAQTHAQVTAVEGFQSMDPRRN
jgi:hypothetical protein